MRHVITDEVSTDILRTLTFNYTSRGFWGIGELLIYEDKIVINVKHDRIPVRFTATPEAPCTYQRVSSDDEATDIVNLAFYEYHEQDGIYKDVAHSIDHMYRPHVVTP